MIGTVKITKIPRSYNEKMVRCVSRWVGRDQSETVTKEGRARLAVFFPPSHLRINTRQVVPFHELLIAKCEQGVKGNPTPKFEWRLNGRSIGNGNEIGIGNSIEYKVGKEDHLKKLECIAIHTTFQDAKEIRVRKERQIRVECKYFF